MADFRMTRRVRFSETDMAGVMHFSCFLRWAEDAEHAFLRSLGLSVVSHDGDGEIGWPRAQARCDYFGSARFEQELELSVAVVRLGEKSVTYVVEFFAGGERIAVARITSVCCRVRGDVFESIRIPEAFRSQLAPHVRDAGESQEE